MAEMPERSHVDYVRSRRERTPPSRNRRTCLLRATPPNYPPVVSGLGSISSRIWPSRSWQALMN
jgi:hypothetical protein